MTIRFASSVTFTKSYLPPTPIKRPASSRTVTVLSRCRRAPVGVSVVNIVLLSVVEIEATWPRPEERGRARVGKAQYRERAPLCQLHYVPLQCHVKWQAVSPKGPGAFFPFVACQYSATSGLSVWNRLRDDILELPKGWQKSFSQKVFVWLNKTISKTAKQCTCRKYVFILPIPE